MKNLLIATGIVLATLCLTFIFGYLITVSKSFALFFLIILAGLLTIGAIISLKEELDK